MTTFTDGVNTLVNGIYPVPYFSLPGVDEIQYPDSFWWSSKLRFAAVDDFGSYLSVVDGGTRTSEILEIDLGRIREVNYLNMDILRAPIDIKIEYDALSTPDRTAIWVPVVQNGDLPFNNSITFDTTVRTAWFNGEYNFTDPKGNMVHTRYLRITFTRRDEPFPTKQSAPFEWPIFVKQLRLGRYVAVLRDTVGPLLNQDTPKTIVADVLPSLVAQDNTREARQRFIIPSSSVRVGETPNLIGFGVLVQTVAADTPFDQTQTDQQVSYGWSVWDITNASAPFQVRAGVENGVITPGLSWLDFYLDDADIIPGDTSKTYELRVRSLDDTASNTVYTHAPNDLSSRAVPGTLNFTHNSSAISTSQDTRSVVHIGDYLVRSDLPDQVFVVNNVTSTTITINVPYPGASGSAETAIVVFPFSDWDPNAGAYVLDGSRNLVMRVWADIADEGRDVLGNAYRHISRRQKAEYVQDNTQPGWMSQPVPTADAVEALYFDVRTLDEDDHPALSLIEAIRISPRTPGVRMNVYYSQQNLDGLAPRATGDWDYLLWIPVQETYTLRRDEVIQLPQPIRAGFIKLEFTALNPLPFAIPSFPPLPPRRYRRFPTWVEDQFNNAQLRTVIQDWFLRNATPVESSVLKTFSDPVQEFAYQQREFLGALALGKIADSQVVNSGLVDIADKALVDPVTASKIYVSLPNQYQNSLLLTVDTSSVLGQLVIQRFDPTTITDPIEKTAPSVVDGSVPSVSTSTDRVSESYQNIAQIPMRFNKTCRHEYTLEEAEFNKKAYFVGIDSVSFLRNDYTVKHDDTMISDILHDDVMLLENTFTRESGTGIPDGTLLYVSYSINPDIVDEQVFLSGFEAVALAVTGAPARNVLVYDAPSKQGVQYLQNDDYELFYAFDDNGQMINFIKRSSLGLRMTVPKQPIIYVDAGTVIGIAVIPSPPTDDAAVITGVAVISGIEGPFVPNYGTGTYGGDGTSTYGNMAGHFTDASQATGVAHPSSTDTRDMFESATVIGVAVISGTDIFT